MIETIIIGGAIAMANRVGDRWFDGVAERVELATAEAPQRVESIDQDRVQVDKYDRPREASARDYAIRNSDGIKSLRDALSEMVAEEVQRQIDLETPLRIPGTRPPLANL